MNLVQLTRHLIDIPSITGEEFEVGNFLEQYLSGLGYEITRQEIEPRRSNILATTGSPPRIVLSTHMDTVPPHIPSREDDEQIYGRGACDAKGIIAAQIFAAERLRRDLPDIGLLFTVDEEAGSLGAVAANSLPIASACQFLINGEPTDNKLASGTKGSLRLKIVTQGRAAHSAYPEHGDSAVEKLLDVLNKIRQHDWPVDSHFGETTCNIGTINGGTRANVIPETAEAVLQIRLTTSAESIKRDLEALVGERASIDYLSQSEPTRLYTLAPFETSLVRFTTDIPHLPNWGTPLLLGPGSILNAHTEHERVEKQQLFEAVDLYVSLVHSLQKSLPAIVATMQKGTAEL